MGGGSVDHLERMVECEVCKALNEIHGLNRACDLFDTFWRPRAVSRRDISRRVRALEAPRMRREHDHLHWGKW